MGAVCRRGGWWAVLSVEKIGAVDMALVAQAPVGKVVVRPLLRRKEAIGDVESLATLLSYSSMTFLFCKHAQCTTCVRKFITSKHRET